MSGFFLLFSVFFQGKF